MWKIINDRKNLVCTYYAEVAESSALDSDKEPEVVDVTYIHFSKQTEGQISVKIRISAHAPSRFNANREQVTFAESLKNKICEIINPTDVVLEQDPCGDGFIRFKINVERSLVKFNDVVKALDDKMHDFPKIEDKIPVFLNPPREVVVATAVEIKRRRTRSVENHADNNMFGVIVTAMLSEQNLSRMYNFPAPNYSRWHKYEPVAVLADYEEDLPSVLFEDCDPSNYSALENQAISDLRTRLNTLAQELTERGYLDLIDDQYYLKESTTYLLKNYHQSDDFIYKDLLQDENLELACEIITDDEVPIKEQKDRARLAHDVHTAMRALTLSDDVDHHPHGSHSHNGLMTKTKIKGRGIRYVIALIWHACMLSHQVQATGATGLVNYNPADDIEQRRRVFLEIMARAIANGARGGNRNLVAGFNTTFFEDMAVTDSPVCGQGLYNFSFDAFNNILKGIDLVYDVPELFLSKVKQYIYQTLVNRPDIANLEVAKQFIKEWNGTGRFPLTLRNQAAYKDFKEAVQNGLLGFKAQFVLDFTRGNPDFKQIIEDDLKFHIGEDAKLYELLNYPLDEAEMIRAWQEKQRQQARAVPPPPKTPPPPPPPQGGRGRKFHKGVYFG